MLSRMLLAANGSAGSLARGCMAFNPLCCLLESIGLRLEVEAETRFLCSATDRTPWLLR